jgi:hypothetical protein
MPVAKIHVLEGRYDERRLTNVSRAVQEALILSTGMSLRLTDVSRSNMMSII